MPFSFDIAVRRTGLAANAIIGAQSATIETNYAASPLLPANFDGAAFPYTSITDAVLSSLGRIAQAIADTKKHPFRRNFADTIVLVNNSQIPIIGTSGNPVIGVYGDVRLVSGNILMMPTSMETVARWQRRGSSNYAHGTIYEYYISDTGFVYATQGAVNLVIECCSYSRTAQQTLLTAHGNVPLPDSLEDLLVAGAITALHRDGRSADFDGRFANYFAIGLTQIQQGATTLMPPRINIPAGSEMKLAA